MNQNWKARADLVRAADAARSRLVRTAERLDQRRHEAFDIRHQLEHHLRRVAFTGGLLLVATAGVAAFVTYRVATAAQRRWRSRWRVLKSAWDHPEREVRPEPPPLVNEILRSACLKVAIIAVSAAARRVFREPRAAGG